VNLRRDGRREPDAMADATDRLDNFTDAAFAFSLSLLVIGSNAVPSSLDELRAAVADIPAFAIGFAIVAMFWNAHVQWRRLRGEGRWLSYALTLALVFLVLIYIRPLQGMASSLSTYLGGSGTRFAGDLAGLFLIYGAGFSAMSALTAGLFLDARSDPAVTPDLRRRAGGEALIWAVCAATGLISMLVALVPGFGIWSAWTYATLPLSIPLTAALYRWEEPDAA
jgi:uncharacterized membrane protein